MSPGRLVFILLALASPRNELALCLPTALLCLRFEIDLSRLPINERQLYNHALDPGKGRLVCLVTLRPCWGVSISDIETAPLEKPDERDSVEEKFVRSVLISLCRLAVRCSFCYYGFFFSFMFQSLKNSHRRMDEVGFLQVKVIRANDLPATDLNSNFTKLWLSSDDGEGVCLLKSPRVVHTCREKQPFLLGGAGKQQAPDSHRLQDPESGVEQSFYFVRSRRKRGDIDRIL